MVHSMSLSADDSEEDIAELSESISTSGVLDRRPAFDFRFFDPLDIVRSKVKLIAAAVADAIVLIPFLIMREDVAARCASIIEEPAKELFSSLPGRCSPMIFR